MDQPAVLISASQFFAPNDLAEVRSHFLGSPTRPLQFPRFAPRPALRRLRRHPVPPPRPPLTAPPRPRLPPLPSHPPPRQLHHVSLTSQYRHFARTLTCPTHRPGARARARAFPGRRRRARCAAAQAAARAAAQAGEGAEEAGKEGAGGRGGQERRRGGRGAEWERRRGRGAAAVQAARVEQGHRRGRERGR